MQLKLLVQGEASSPCSFASSCAVQEKAELWEAEAFQG